MENERLTLKREIESTATLKTPTLLVSFFILLSSFFIFSLYLLLKFPFPFPFPFPFSLFSFSDLLLCKAAPSLNFLSLSLSLSLPLHERKLATAYVIFTQMGKYIKKSSKSAREMTVMDSSSQSYIGVRTRAKTLALQRLQKISNSSSSPPASSGSSYLQLRNRRLQKSPNIALANFSRRQKNGNGNARRRRANSDSRATSRLGIFSVASRSVESDSVSCGRVNDKVKLIEEKAKDMVDTKIEIHENENVAEIGTQEHEEASFGENLLDFDGRLSRESTPCSLIRKPDSTWTPGSSTKASSTTNDRIQQQNSSPTDVPTAREVDDFFNSAEGEHQRKFIEKYNFDPIKEKPLPGRYEWEKLNH